MSEKLDKDTYYAFDVGTSIQCSRPFYENGYWWFKSSFADIKCSSVKYWDFKKLQAELQGVKEDVDFLCTWGKFNGFDDQHQMHYDDIIKRWKQSNELTKQP